MSDTRRPSQLHPGAWEAAWDRGEVDEFDELLSRTTAGSGSRREPGPDPVQGVDRRHPIGVPRPESPSSTRSSIEGDRAAIRWHSSGTHEHSLLGVPATKRKVEVSGATFARFEGDRSSRSSSPGTRAPCCRPRDHQRRPGPLR